MSSLLQSFIRRQEKLLSGRPTVPTPGTNYVDDVWLDSDIFPGELTVDLVAGRLYTSDGEGILFLNAENVILSGLCVKKDTSGVNKLTISTGSVRIAGRDYYHTSSGTDVLLPYNIGAYPELYFIYGQVSASLTGSTGSGNYLLAIGYTSVSGPVTEPGGIFSAVSSTGGTPPIPGDAILLGTVLLNPGATGFELWPLTVACDYDYYPKFSTTPSELLRTEISKVKQYAKNTLYFPGTILIDEASNTEWLAKKTFVSDPISILNDQSAGNIYAIAAGGSGGSGASAMYAGNVGTGATVYKETVGDTFFFRSITGSGPVSVSNPGGGDTITIGLSTSGFLLGASNVGSSIQVFKQNAGGTAEFRSLTASSSRITVTQVGDSIAFDVPNVGFTGAFQNTGTGASVFGGTSTGAAQFRSVRGSTGISTYSDSLSIYISTTAEANSAVNIGTGIGSIYAGKTGPDLRLRTIAGTGSVSVTTVGDTIFISATGSTATSSTGQNIGATGFTAGQVYIGMSGSALSFRSIISGPGVTIAQSGNDIIVASLGVPGSTGPQGSAGTNGTDGITGATGSQGPQGFRGPQGFQGASGQDGFLGGTGPQGPQGYGPQGSQGPAGLPASITEGKAIDVYDNVGGWEISSGSARVIPLQTTRTNNSPSTYSVGSTAQYNLPNGNYVEILEDGYYVFDYSVSATLRPDTLAKFYLHELISNLPVDGSDVYLRGLSANDSRSAAGHVVLGLSAGNQYGIRGEVNVLSTGTASGIVDSSSLAIYKLETGYGPTGGIGPQGYEGPQGIGGPQGFDGPQGIPGPLQITAGRINYFTSVAAVGTTNTDRYFTFSSHDPAVFGDPFGSRSTHDEASSVICDNITFSQFKLHVLELNGATSWAPGGTAEVAFVVNGFDQQIFFIDNTVLPGDIFTIGATVAVSANDTVSVRTRNNDLSYSATFVLTVSQEIGVGPTGPQGPQGGGLLWSAAPTATNSPGTTGDIAFDIDFFYVAVDTDTWKRIRLSTW